VPTVASPYGISTWPVRLGPTPFKPQTSNPSLPPKPPHHSTQRASTISSTTPAKTMSSNENLNLDEQDVSKGTSERVTLKRLKNFESLNYESSKQFGSLDSLRDIANGSREDLSAKTDGKNISGELNSSLFQRILFLSTSFLFLSTYCLGFSVRRPRYFYTNFRHMTS
jgi:hypothetical protein